MAAQYFNLLSDLYLASKTTEPVPTGGVNEGQLYQVGSIYGIAFTTSPNPLLTSEISPDLINFGSSAALDSYCFLYKGVMKANKAAQTQAAGAVLYWDSGATVVTTTNSTGNTKVGFVRKAAASGDATVEMDFDGTLGV